MRTVFITIFQGAEFKNIVRTDIYRELVSEPDLRIVFFTNTPAKKAYYEREFSAPNVIYEVVEDYRPAPLLRLFWFLKFNLIRTKTLDIKRKHKLAADKNYPAYFMTLAVNRLFARAPVRKLTRLLDFYLVRDRFFSPYFEKYSPSLVFLAHLFGEVETALLRETKKQGVKSIGLINSWDKLTARCMIRLLPDLLLVHNNLVKADAMRHADMPGEKIAVVGVPNFDYYFQSRRTPKAEFYKRLSLKPEEKIMLFCPAGRTNNAADTAMLAVIDNLVQSGKLPKNLRLIVRFPPNDDVILPINLKNKIIFQMPGKRFSNKRGTDWDMTFNDFKELADTLHHASVVISYSSTVTVDAAILNKPVINVALEFPGTPSSNWLYEVDHYEPVLHSGAMRLARTEGELIVWINKYLEHPEFDQEGRRRLSEAQCFKLDGQAGKRVAQILLANLGQAHSLN